MTLLNATTGVYPLSRLGYLSPKQTLVYGTWYVFTSIYLCV